MSEQTKQKLQEKYVLYQLLNQNMESLKQQFEIVQNQFLELGASMDVVGNLKEMNETNEVLIPLGSGCYGKGKVTERNEILMNVGAGIFVEKKSGSAKTFLEKRFKDMEKASDEIKGHMEKIATQMNEIGLEIQKLSGK